MWTDSGVQLTGHAQNKAQIELLPKIYQLTYAVYRPRLSYWKWDD